MSHRVLVVRDGGSPPSLRASDATPDRVIAVATGAARVNGRERSAVLAARSPGRRRS